MLIRMDWCRSYWHRLLALWQVGFLCCMRRMCVESFRTNKFEILYFILSWQNCHLEVISETTESVRNLLNGDWREIFIEHIIFDMKNSNLLERSNSLFSCSYVLFFNLSSIFPPIIPINICSASFLRIGASFWFFSDEDTPKMVSYWGGCDIILDWCCFDVNGSASFPRIHVE